MKHFSLVVLLLVCSASSVMAFGSSKFTDEVAKEAAAVKLAREVVTGGYDLVTTGELAAILKSGEELLLIDTMPYEKSYKKGHIPTARQFLFPIPEMTSWDKDETAGKSSEDYRQLLGPDLDKKIIVYCGFVKCTRSHNGALWAKKLGYKNVYRYPGGIYAWKGGKNEMETVK